ncbi:hypothetical protein [Parendozoicomonas sp. Alg238-R29]|uniref:hypothetical protein n=1 Tax=Parendozoicomonas sp. Alg238-R29 TaxID=2993446 RepID=UPI00248E6FEC|nr:hypothetical protein [Parendozoicomonas sp. Alg238-R29]
MRLEYSALKYVVRWLVGTVLVLPAVLWADCSFTPCDSSADNKCELGATSVGQFQVCMNISASYQIWGLNNIDLGTLTPSSSVPSPSSMSFCVYSNQDDQKFTLAVDSASGTGGNLALREASAGTIATNVNYTLEVATTGGTTATFSQYGTSQVFSPATGSAPNPFVACSGANVTAKVTLDSGSFKDANQGVYTDTLMLTVKAG